MKVATKIGHAVLLFCLLFPQPLLSQEFAQVLEMDLVVHFIDVGIGDAVFIELPDRQHEVVIDGGDIRRGYNFIDYIKPSVDGAIELAVITHPDYDHWSGIERLCDTFALERLWDPGYGRDCRFKGSKAEAKRQKDTYLKFIDTVSQSPIELNRPAKADAQQEALEMDGVKFWMLHTEDDPAGPDCAFIINNASIVIKMQYKEVTFLFTGDANGLDRNSAGSTEPEYVEADLLALEEAHPGILKADVLKVPHHGSTTASSTKFIKAVSPKFAVISSASTSHYHLPSYRVVRRYQSVRTMEGGKIKKVLRTNYGEKNFENRNFGDDHIICATDGEKEDLVCDYELGVRSALDSN